MRAYTTPLILILKILIESCYTYSTLKNFQQFSERLISKLFYVITVLPDERPVRPEM
jgi:hypothetical protein